MFADLPPLDCSSLEVLRELSKDVLQELSREEAAIHRTTGASLVIKTTLFEHDLDEEKAQKRPKVHATCQRCKKRKIACDGFQPCNKCAKQPEECRYPPGVTPLMRNDEQSLQDTNNNHHAANSSSSSRQPQPQQQQLYFIDRFPAKQQTTPTPPVNVPPPTPPASAPLPSTRSQTSPKPFQVSTDNYGHFFGETSFFLAAAPSSHPLPFSQHTLTAATVFPTHLLLPPDMTFADVISLVDTYYTYADPFYPIIMNKQDLLTQLKKCIANEPACLSPLYFNAMFIRALAIQSTTAGSKANAWRVMFMENVLSNWSHYLDNGHFSTVLALVALANHLERSKSSRHLTRAWIFVSVAARLAVDMGYHRVPNSTSSGYQAQTVVRTFWTAFVTERTFCMMYGRPSMFEERDIDTPVPMLLDQDEPGLRYWVKNLLFMITMAKVTGRTMRFLYNAHAETNESYHKSNAFVASVDSWICTETDILEKRLQEKSKQCRTDDLGIFYLLSSLILLHRPSVQHDKPANSYTRASHEICFLAAILLTHIACSMPLQQLLEACYSPPTVYALIMALHIHLVNASSPVSERRNIVYSEISFEKTLSLLRSLPQTQGPDSMVAETIHTLNQLYQRRSNSIVSGFAMLPNSSSSAESNATIFVGSTSEACGNSGSNSSIGTTLSLPPSLPLQQSNTSSAATTPVTASMYSSNNFKFISFTPQAPPPPSTRDQQQKPQIPCSKNNSSNDAIMNNASEEPAILTASPQPFFVDTSFEHLLLSINDETDASNSDLPSSILKQNSPYRWPT